ncbi:MAG: HEAT repeat domain-containing protein [Propionibacteriaceae bacterium]|nr:HEAT repeat domain-containing protein [Propionibacteriaceae bacterium]
MEWLKIGEVARRTGLTHRTLRHYDDLGLLVPSGRSGGDYRLYAPEDLERLLSIQHLKSLGMGLDEIGRALDDPAFDATEALARHAALVEGRIAAEQDLLARLRRLQEASGTWDEVLEAIALTERLRHPDAWVRFRTALGASTEVSVDELLDALRDEPEAGVREVLTWAVVQHGPVALDAVTASLADPDPGVRKQMAHVLGKLADPDAVPALVGLLGDDPDVAAKAAFGLGQIGGPDAAGALAEVLGSGGSVLRATVVTALGGLGADAVGPVLGRVEAPSAAVRADAAEVLGALGDDRAVPALEELLGDAEEDVRITALMALGALGGPAAARAIGSAQDAPGRTGSLARRLTPPSEAVLDLIRASEPR